MVDWDKKLATGNLDTRPYFFIKNLILAHLKHENGTELHRLLQRWPHRHSDQFVLII